MFLSNNKYCDTSQVNQQNYQSPPPPLQQQQHGSYMNNSNFMNGGFNTNCCNTNTNNSTNNATTTTTTTTTTNNNNSGLIFPTSIFENLLQNSDIMETLMKPIATGGNGDLIIDENFFAKKLEDKDDTKIYGNAFLGPNLWNKNELFPSEKFNVKLEYVDVQEFLAENNLDEVEFLDELNSLECKNNNNNSSTNSNSNSSSDNSSLNSINNNKNPLPQLPPLPTQQSANNKNTDKNDLSFGSELDDLTGMILGGSARSSQDSRFSDDQDNDFLNDDDDSMLSDEQLFAKISKFSGDESSFDAFRKSKKQYVPNELKDEKYWNRRRKNNLAAKRSRDARRMKESQVALRAAFLERENSSLKRQLEDFKRETRILKTKLSRYEQQHQQQQQQQQQQKKE